MSNLPVCYHSGQISGKDQNRNPLLMADW